MSILHIYKDCFPVIDAVRESLAAEFARLEERISRWDEIPKTEEMLAEAQRVENIASESGVLMKKFAAGIEYAITLKKQKLSVAEAVEGVLARHELNRLRRLDLWSALQPDAGPKSDDDPVAYLGRWNRVARGSVSGVVSADRG